MLFPRELWPRYYDVEGITRALSWKRETEKTRRRMGLVTYQGSIPPSFLALRPKYRTKIPNQTQLCAAVFKDQSLEFPKSLSLV
eukprot:5563855-Amphidinium_carterae.1